MVFFFCLLLTNIASPLYSQNNTNNNFTKYFADSAFARFVAGRMNKKITDNVTTKELASIKGDFDIGVEPVSNLKEIGYLTGIETFYCYKNAVTEIPAETGNLIHLKYLDLCKAFELKKIPKEIGLLKHLKMIRLCLTGVNVISKEIGNLSELETLGICCNKLKAVPKEAGNLKKLKSLDIHSNNLSVLPNEIGNLKSLTSLDLSYCSLKQLPENIRNLKKLQSLNLFNNDLKYLPTNIAGLHELSYLHVYDNFKLSESYKSHLPTSLRNKKRK